jgi:hypothetical protein
MCEQLSVQVDTRTPGRFWEHCVARFDNSVSVVSEPTNHVDDISSIQQRFSTLEGSCLRARKSGWYQEAGTQSLRLVPYEKDQMRWTEPMSAVQDGQCYLLL